MHINYNLTKTWKALGSYSKGFRNPSIKERYLYFVDQNHHQEGVGKAMLNSILGQIEALEIEHLLAILLDNNYASIALLEKCDFAGWGKLPGITTLETEEGKVGQVIYGYSANG